MDRDKLRPINKAEVRNVRYGRELLLTSVRASTISSAAPHGSNRGVAFIAVVSPLTLLTMVVKSSTSLCSSDRVNIHRAPEALD